MRLDPPPIVGEVDGIAEKMRRSLIMIYIYISLLFFPFIYPFLE